MSDGVLGTILAAVLAALIGGIFTLAVRRSREAVSMTSAWNRIDQLQKDLDVVRIAVRIGEEGFDAMWSWGRRVRDGWNRDEQPPAFTDEEDRAIRRARRSIEIADTTEVPIQTERK
jgi:hypothetical protein